MEIFTNFKLTPKELNKHIKKHNIAEKYFEDDLLNETFLEFIKHRKQVKNQMSEIAIKKAVNKINKFNCDTSQKVEAIEKAIMHNWSGIFDPGESKNNTSRKAADF